ncbi:TetR/AcrR family transcriptional regulator [Amycolatopsis sp. cmx-11-12]|uniref:TetR/AcrR family transcriptional regulator n=1 Tax=Amycolatopsis sp. cmx-11-12 TaxID=2785795 RepID=UPI0039182F66
MTDSTSSTARRRGAAARSDRLSRAQRRDQLLDSAAALFDEHGFDAITMERVAQRAGVSKALPYSHFENAEDLVASLRDRELSALALRLVESTMRVEGFEDRVRVAVRTWFEVFEERGRLLASFLRWLPDFEVASGSRPSRETPFDWFLAELFQRQRGLSPAVARVTQRIFVMGLVGALDACSEGHLPQEQVEQIAVCLAIGGVDALSHDTAVMSGAEEEDSAL